MDNFLERITLMTAEENILAGQKELNKLYLKYQGTKYKKCPETGVMDEATLISLRQAIQIEAKPDSYYSYFALKKSWEKDAKMRQTITNELTSQLNMFAENPMARLANIAFALHGIDSLVDNDVVGNGFFESQEAFANNLGVGTNGIGMSMSHRCWVTLLSNRYVLTLPELTDFSIRIAQQNVNRILDQLLEKGLHPDKTDNESDDNAVKLSKYFEDNYLNLSECIYGYTDGDYETILDTNIVLKINTTKSCLYTILKCLCQLSQPDKTDLNLSDSDEPKAVDTYLKEFNDSLGVKEDLTKCGLIIDGFMSIDVTNLDAIPSDVYNLARINFTYRYQTVDHTFYQRLFFGSNIRDLSVPDVRYVATIFRTDGEEANGLQSFDYRHSDNQLFFDQLHNKTNNDLFKMPFNYWFELNERVEFSVMNNRILGSSNFLHNKPDIEFGHTQTLIVRDNLLITGCNYKDHIHHAHYGNLKTGAPDNPKKEATNIWCADFIIFDFPNDKFTGKYKILTGIFDVVDSLGGGAEPYRVEMSVSPDLKYLLIAPIDSSGTQYFLLYDYATFKQNLNKCPDKGVINLKNIPLLDEFDINKFAVGSEINTDMDDVKFDSVQGYAIDNDKTVYVSSQKGPKHYDRWLKSQAKLIRIPWKAYANKINMRIIPTVDNTLFDAIIKSKDEKLRAFPEVEAYQIIDDKYGILSITWHIIHPTDYEHIENIPLKDRLAQINLFRKGDRVDMYRVTRH